MDRTPESSFDGPMVDLFDFGTSPIDGGADFACSWSGRNGGQLIVRADVLHASSGTASAAIPRERLQGWSVRPDGDAADLILQSNDELHLRVPLDLVPVIERALTQLQNG